MTYLQKVQEKYEIEAGSLVQVSKDKANKWVEAIESLLKDMKLLEPQTDSADKGFLKDLEENLHNVKRRIEKILLKPRLSSASTEVIAVDPSKRPPKQFFDKMYSKIKKNNPSYSDEQIRKTIGSLWYHKMSKGKKVALRKREGKHYGNPPSKKK